MTLRKSVFSILLLTPDADLQAHIEQDIKKTNGAVSVTAAKDIASLPRSAAKRAFDGVILETRRGHLHELDAVEHALDPARTVIVAGSRSVLRRTHGLVVQAMVNGHARPSHHGAGADFFLDDYLESKLGGFVKDMKNGAARNLHPMLIKAVERPLIARVLQETNGNQIQAAHLLGLSRNTLRKKITDLRISVKREKVRKS
ncbi:MAG TPA: helix-turn-helix domain-containing protein [Nitrospiraceae bacterium]|nr:helix-turn-helix domain-containing protein [Nitrospiraceae bacterium]